MFKDPYEMAAGCDGLMVVTEWNEFKQLDLDQLKSVLKQPVIFDGRNIYDPALMKEKGFTYRADRARAPERAGMPAPEPPICDYEGSDYQASFWEQGGREYEDRAEAVALRRLLPPAGSLLLELGAGAGRNTPRYAGFHRVVLLDFSRTQLEQAQSRLGTSTATSLWRLTSIACLSSRACSMPPP